MMNFTIMRTNGYDTEYWTGCNFKEDAEEMVWNLNLKEDGWKYYIEEA